MDQCPSVTWVPPVGRAGYQPPAFIRFLGLDISQGLAFGRVFLRLSGVGHFPLQTCRKRWNSDHVTNSCVSYNKGSHFFSGYGLLVAVENACKGNGNILR